MGSSSSCHANLRLVMPSSLLGNIPHILEFQWFCSAVWDPRTTTKCTVSGLLKPVVQTPEVKFAFPDQYGQVCSPHSGVCSVQSSQQQHQQKGREGKLKILSI